MEIKTEGIGASPIPSAHSGVGDGTRTHDSRNHNPVLYQLNYTHHILINPHGLYERLTQKGTGTPEGIRTPGLLLRRQLLYPAELQSHATINALNLVALA